MNVSNKKCIRRLSFKNMKSAKGRNVIAVIAITLTTLLFTALFTIIGSISYGFEQSNFRQIGTCAHGEFKRLSYEQYETLKNDKAIVKYGLRRVAGIASGDAFRKHTAEISYCSKNAAEWMYLIPDTGRLPDENSDELATDRKVLSLLGAKGEIGENINIVIDVDGVEVTKSFTLCGIWEYDGALPVSHILISEKAVDNIISANNLPYLDENIGSYGLNVMLKSDINIEDNLVEIINRNSGCNVSYNNIGVNWGYISQNDNFAFDSSSLLALSVLLLIIITAGYLIIFNVFRISVTNDIRHYGLLKTIGTTGRQIRRIVLIQALTLSAIGIPIGLVLGWLVGSLLTPVVINELNVYNAGASANPIIFVFSAAFAVVTVIISCLKPAKIAAEVSPVEAIRYTESSGKANVRKSAKGISVFGMAMANMGRSKGKTALTIVSLALSTALFGISFTFANSFSMDKYLNNVSNDFIVSSAEYFKTSTEWSPDNAITHEDIAAVTNLEGIENSFTCYGSSYENTPDALYTEEQLLNIYSRFVTDEATFNEVISTLEKREELYVNITQILGFEKSGFPKIKVIEGELDKLTEDGYIAVENSGNFKVGDNLTLIFTDSIKYINNTTGEETDDINFVIYNDWSDISVEKETHEKNYTICATVDLPHSLGYRYTTTADVFIMESGNFISAIKEAAPLYTAMDVADEYETEIEMFIKNYTENSMLNYSSKVTAAAEFESFRRMFLILSSSLSGIIGLIGLLNFINTILTGIFARKRELSVLRSIGMTGRQLESMLIFEGLLYTLSAVLSGFALNILILPFSSVIENIFWFCDYKFTAIPFIISAPLFIIIGIILPLITYKIFSKKSVIERLRESE